MKITCIKNGDYLTQSCGSIKIKSALYLSHVDEYTREELKKLATYKIDARACNKYNICDIHKNVLLFKDVARVRKMLEELEPAALLSQTTIN